MLDRDLLEISHRLLYRPLPSPGPTGRVPATPEWLAALRAQKIGDGELPGPPQLDAQLRLCERLGIGAVAMGDPDYPACLLALAHPPAVLFYRGALPPDPDGSVAVVGSRRASRQGREMAEQLGRTAAAAGLPVISGLARGIDQAAHRGALERGETWAVLGCGLDRCYPPEAERLAREVTGSGGLLSEFPPGCPPLPFHFPRRNRIIAALCRLLVVVEAGERSGALSTAAEALALGREVAAVPGHPIGQASRGSNRLLAEGAALLLDPEGMLELMGVLACSSSAEPDRPWSAERCLREGIEDMETLSVRAGWLLTETIARVGEWELRGELLRLPGGRFRVRGIARGDGLT